MAAYEQDKPTMSAKFLPVESHPSTSDETFISSKSDSEENRSLECNIAGARTSSSHSISGESLSSNRLKFSVKLEKIFTPPLLHPCLHLLLQYIYENGPLTPDCNLIDLSPVDLDDKREIKSRLRSGQPFCLPDYSLPAIVHVVRSFLRHLPQPVLHFNLYHTWVSTGEIIHQYCYLPSKRDLVIHAIQQLLTELNSHEELLLRHLLTSLRSLTQPMDSESPELGRVHQIAHLFVPCLIRRRFDWPGSNPRTEAKVALVTFFILQLHRIFGSNVRNLYPIEFKCSASCCNIIPEPNIAVDLPMSEGQKLLQTLVESHLPKIDDVTGMADIAAQEEVL